MAWITYESDKIVHVPSNTAIITGAYKIGWDYGFERHMIIHREDKEFEFYDSECENDLRILVDIKGIEVSLEDRRYFVVVPSDRYRPQIDLDKWLGGLDTGTLRVFTFDNLKDYFTITLYHHRVSRLLFISTDEQMFEKAKEVLQSGLGAIRIDVLNGMPSDCEDPIRLWFKTDVLGEDYNSHKRK